MVLEDIWVFQLIDIMLMELGLLIVMGLVSLMQFLQFMEVNLFCCSLL